MGTFSGKSNSRESDESILQIPAAVTAITISGRFPHLRLVLRGDCMSDDSGRECCPRSENPDLGTRLVDKFGLRYPTLESKNDSRMGHPHIGAGIGDGPCDRLGVRGI